MLKQELIYQNIKIEYFLKNSLQNNFQIKYQPPMLIVIAPIQIAQFEVERLIISKWKQIQKWLAMPTFTLFNLTLIPYFAFFLNKQYQLQINASKIKNQVVINCDTIVINLCDQSRHKVSVIFNQFLKQQAKIFLTTRVIMWSQKMNLQYLNLNFRVLRSKWGSCQFERKSIVLNARIMHFDYAIIDYVIVHELAHLQHPNHSKNFWIVVAKYYPEFKKAQKFLHQLFF